VKERVDAWTCAESRRPVCRVAGLAGGVLREDGALSVLTVARGYCREHIDHVLRSWVEELERMRRVEWVSDPPVALRPRDVRAFLAEADSRFGVWNVEDTGAGGQACPHCRAELELDAGPHLAGMSQRPGSRAWVCTGCGAAGLAFGIN
jgi:hypothetical protein